MAKPKCLHENPSPRGKTGFQSQNGDRGCVVGGIARSDIFLGQCERPSSLQMFWTIICVQPSSSSSSSSSSFSSSSAGAVCRMNLPHHSHYLMPFDAAHGGDSPGCVGQEDPAPQDKFDHLGRQRDGHAGCSPSRREFGKFRSGHRQRRSTTQFTGVLLSPRVS